MTIVFPLPIGDQDMHNMMDLTRPRKGTDFTNNLLPPSSTDDSPNPIHLVELAHPPSKPRPLHNLLAHSDPCRYNPKCYISDLTINMSPTSLAAHLLLHQTDLGLPHQLIKIIE